ncbi:protein of unknown function [Devosia sp. YR412]|uniref:DUF1902 domain-containing protein n=1 Tax=Devosia sp. YR412 TaxID=1881030 RepID=UPI0008B268E2|nr:DUF1902 domain-containing protein [Devosia sp. YR412]SEP76659.1 protein of unknown function [Devosia sp. YR412]
MSKRIFNVTAHWDNDTMVFYSQSDIIGLHIEAKSIEEFEAVLVDVKPDLLIANHACTANAILRDAGSSIKL